MTYLIMRITSEYDPKRFSLPWAAPCDETGRARFDGVTGHFTGSPGEPGDLIIVDPPEGSVWVFSQKDYRAVEQKKTYIKFSGDKVYTLKPDELALALANMPKCILTSQRKDELLRILFEIVSKVAAARFGDLMGRFGITRAEVETYGVTWEDAEETKETNSKNKNESTNK